MSTTVEPPEVLPAERPEGDAAPARNRRGGKAIWIALGIAVVAAANFAAWRATVDPSVELEGLWVPMGKVKVPDRPGVAPDFPPELRAQRGRRVKLSGVAFVPEGAAQDGRVQWCVLMPRSRYGCCGISCDPRPELSVHVDTSARPWPAPASAQALATIEGTLQLEDDASTWCLYRLEDAVLRLEEP